MYTNIPTFKLAINSVKKRWNFISNNILIPEDEFLTGLKLILNSTFFVFNNSFYKQTFGISMGSSLSPLIADIVMQDLECNTIAKLLFQLPFYYRCR